jgi:O-antigen ligase
MPQVKLIPFIMAVSALAALTLLVPAFKRARAAGDLDSSAVLTFSMGWLVSLPIVLVVISGGLVRKLDAFGELVPVLPAWYRTVLHGCLAIVVGLAALFVSKRMISPGRHVPVNAAGLFAIVLWLVAHLAAELHSGPFITLDGVVLLVCLVAATVLPRGRGACVGIGFFGVTLAIGSGILATFNLGLASVPCRHECLLGVSLTGLLPNENLLGTTIAATLPFAYLGFRRPVRLWLVAYLGATAIATGSRGALLTALIALVVLLIVSPALDADRGRTRGAALAGLVLAGALVASLYVVQHNWGASNALTSRPQLWSVAKDYIRESPLFGYGPYKWETLSAGTGEIPQAAQHSTHNQWIEVLFTAGWVGAGLLVAMMVAALRSAGYARPAVLATLATLLLIGVGERIWSIGVIDFASFSLVGLILLGPTRVSERSGLATQPVRAHSRRLLAVPSS